MPHHHKGPHHPHHHHRPLGDRLSEGLNELVRTGHIRDLEQLAAAADEHEPDGGNGEYLRRNCHDLPLPLALELLASFRRAQEHRRHQKLVGDAEHMIIAIVPPIPPHIYGMFGHHGSVTMLQLDDHDLPPHMRSRLSFRCIDAHEARRFIKTADLVVFDAYANGTIHVRQSLADLLDGQLLKPQALLRAHFRPHLAHDDVEVDDDIRARIERI